MWFFGKSKNVLKAERDAYLNAYDEVATELNRDRRTSSIEVQGEVELLSFSKRFKLIANVRENIREFSLIGGWEDQFERNVIGKGQSLNIKTDVEGSADKANAWFRQWAKSPDAFDAHKSLGNLSRLWLTSYRRDGDVLVYFDHLGLINPGKTITFESDQLTTISNNSIDKKATQNWVSDFLNPFDRNTKDWSTWKERTGKITQSAGVLFSKFKVIIGYVVATGGGRAKSSCSFEINRDNTLNQKNECMVLPVTDCYLIYRTKRVNSYRGVTAYLAAINAIIDVKEILGFYKKRMKVQSSMALVYKTKGGDRLRNRAKAQGKDVPSITSAKTTPIKPLKNFINFFKGAIEEIDINDEITPIAMAADQQALQDVLKFIMQIEAWGQGLGRLYAHGVGESSYTAARAEANLTEVTFQDEKDLMSEFYDWLASQAFKYADSNNLATLPDNFKFTWTNWPTMPQIDPVKDTKASTDKLKAGLTTLENILGSEWKAILTQLGLEREEAEKLGLFLAEFNVKEDKNNDTSDEDDDTETIKGDTDE